MKMHRYKINIAIYDKNMLDDLLTNLTADTLLRLIKICIIR